MKNYLIASMNKELPRSHGALVVVGVSVSAGSVVVSAVVGEAVKNYYLQKIRKRKVVP